MVKFEVIGTVEAVESFMGSFAKVTINGESFSCSLNQDLQFPKVGERVRVWGIIGREGRKGTEGWDYAP